MNFLSRLKRWRIAALIVVIVIIAGGAFVVYRNATGPESTGLAEDQQLVAVRRGDLVNEISVSGSVSFPERENMTFGSKGVVADVLVKEGERVSAGDVIARLDAETIARLEREVTEANAALRDAQDALDDLVSPPDLTVAEARQAVAQAQDALDDAEDALDEIVSPTDLQVSDMASRIASAERALQAAEDALSDEMETPSELEIAQAARGVADAEIALDNLEDSPTALEVAQANDRVAGAEVALKDAKEALEKYENGTNDEDVARDLANARQDLETGKVNLANARTDYAVAQRDLEVRADDAQKALDDAGQAYADTFYRWLGIVETPEAIDPDYEAAFAGYGVDLDALFSEPDRGEGLRFGEAVPPDDPATAWNETHVYVWLHFSRQDLEPTCDPDDLPTPVGICIEREFRVAGEAYQDAIDGKAKADADAGNALTAVQASIDAAQSAIENAEDRIEDLTEPIDPIVRARMQSAVRVAEEDLADARQNLADLTNPTDPLKIAADAREIETARATLADARERLAELNEPKDASIVADLTAKVELARANLEDLRSQQTELLSGEDRPEYLAAFHAVEVARETLAKREEDLDKLLNNPDPIDRDLLRSRVEAARTTLEESQERLADATGLKAPSDGFISRVNAEEGKDIEANDIVAVLVDIGVVEVDGSVDEIDVLSIELGVDAEVEMDALPDQTILGKVSFVGAEAVEQQGGGTVNYPVRVEIDLPPDLKAPEGLSAVATIILSRETDVLLIPANAIRGTFDNPTVHLMVNDEAVETPVALGSSDDFWTIVTDGLNEGDMVVALAPEGQNVQFFTGGPDDDDGNGEQRGPGQ